MSSLSLKSFSKRELTRRVPLVEQELLTLAEHLSSPPVFSGVPVTRSLVLYVCFVDRCLSFCTFLLAIALSVLLRYTDSHCPFGIFKLFLSKVYESLLSTEQITKVIKVIQNFKRVMNIISKADKY